MKVSFIGVGAVGAAMVPIAEVVSENMQQAMEQGLQDRDWSVAATIRRKR